MNIATVKTLVYATGWRPTLDQPRPNRENFKEGLALAKKRGLSIHRDGRCYVPYQRFLPRHLRKNPKAPG